MKLPVLIWRNAQAVENVSNSAGLFNLLKDKNKRLSKKSLNCHCERSEAIYRV
jgi:hypothetical protein